LWKGPAQHPPAVLRSQNLPDDNRCLAHASGRRNRPTDQGGLLMPDGVGAGWGIMQEIREDIQRVRNSGKPVWAYLRAPSTREYYLAAARRAGSPCRPQEHAGFEGPESRSDLLPGRTGQAGGPGGDRTTRQVQRLRRHVQPEGHESGKRARCSTRFLDDLYGQLISAVATGRKKTPEQARAIWTRGAVPFQGGALQGLVDATEYEGADVHALEKADWRWKLARISPGIIWGRLRRKALRRPAPRSPGRG